MAELFDPYQKWLGIPPAQQPPNPYRLLGIELFESDADVVEHAADRQMAHLRTFQNGPHRDLCQRLLNEVAAARAALLDAEQRAAVDRRIQQQRAAVPPSKAKARPIPVAKPMSPPSPTPGSDGPAQPIIVSTGDDAGRSGESRAAGTTPAAGGRKAEKNIPLEIVKIVGGGAAGIGLALVILWIAGINPLGSSDPDPPSPRPAGGTGTGSRPRPRPRPPAENDPFLPALRTNDPIEPAVDDVDDSSFAWHDWDVAQEAFFYGIRDASVSTPAELREALQKAVATVPLADRMFTAKPPLSKDEQKNLARQVQTAFSQLAEILARADFSSQEVRKLLPELNDALSKVGKSPRKVNVIGYMAAEQLDQTDHATNGLFLAGKVVGMATEGRLYQTRIELAGGSKRIVPIYSWSDPISICKMGDRVLVLGRIVDNPTDNLGGYEGDGKLAVWGGYLLSER